MSKTMIALALENPSFRPVIEKALIGKPEAVLLVRRDGGVLLTCDAIQHYGDYSRNNLPARLIMPYIGFPRTTIVGPFWNAMAKTPSFAARSV